MDFETFERRLEIMKKKTNVNVNDSEIKSIIDRYPEFKKLSFDELNKLDELLSSKEKERFKLYIEEWRNAINEILVQISEETYNQIIEESTQFNNLIDNDGNISESIVDSFKARLYKLTDKETLEKEVASKLKERLDQSYPDIPVLFLQSIIPEKYVIPNTKVANEMTKDFPIGEQLELVVATPKQKNGKTKEVITYVTLNYDAEAISFKGKQLTPYDRVVHNAVCSLSEAGNKVFTPEMVYRAMNGSTDSEKVDTETLEPVIQSIEKCSAIRVEIDGTAEVRLRNLGTGGKYGGYLIATKWAEVTAGGVKKRAYALYEEPVLLTHSKRIGQVISTPVKLLETKSRVRSTGEVIVIREYLLRRIEGMKTKNGLHSNKILYESIYNELNLKAEEIDKSKKTRIKNNTKSILDYWVEEKYIKKYEEYKEGKIIKGIAITH